MYCSSCGGAVATGLTYCNHCGGRLGSAKVEGGGKPTELFPDSLIWAIVTVFVIGLGCLIGLMAVMKNSNFNQGTILGFCLLILVMTVAVEAVFISMLLRRNSQKAVDKTVVVGSRETNELGAARQQALPEPVPSVTEHTTRTFERTLSERKLD